jgi:cobalt/nickel transport protein
MKKYFAATVLIVVFLAAFIPFASSSPDGLEKVASSLGVEEQPPVWHGIMADYSVNALGDSYVSTLTAGIFGAMFVLGATVVLGTAITKHSRDGTEKS